MTIPKAAHDTYLEAAKSSLMLSKSVDTNESKTARAAQAAAEAMIYIAEDIHHLVEMYEHDRVK